MRFINWLFGIVEAILDSMDDANAEQERLQSQKWE